MKSISNTILVSISIIALAFAVHYYPTENNNPESIDIIDEGTKFWASQRYCFLEHGSYPIIDSTDLEFLKGYIARVVVSTDTGYCVVIYDESANISGTISPHNFVWDGMIMAKYEKYRAMATMGNLDTTRCK